MALKYSSVFNETKAGTLVPLIKCPKCEFGLTTVFANDGLKYNVMYIEAFEQKLGIKHRCSSCTQVWYDLMLPRCRRCKHTYTFDSTMSKPEELYIDTTTCGHIKDETDYTLVNAICYADDVNHVIIKKTLWDSIASMCCLRCCM